MKTLKWGIIGTGSIAEAFARGLTQTDSGTAFAVGSRNRKSASDFAEVYGIQRAFTGYDSLLADPEVEAVYISTPHPFHAEWACKAARAGKHVLCEKPAALNRGEAEGMISEARAGGVFFMEAFMYRCHPQTAELTRLISEGAIGEVRMIRASFGFGGGSRIDPGSRIFDPDLGGGAILDVGCYPVSMSRLIAGAAEGVSFREPESVKGEGRIGSTGVDEWAAAVLWFPSGIVAQVSTSVRTALENSVDVFGSHGRITVPLPWTADRKNPQPGKILLTVKGETRNIEIPADRTSYAYEADVTAAAVAAGIHEAAAPAMTWEDTLGNLQVLDAWRSEIGLAYPGE
ncbi:MAG: Gfo/Idh/MocA family protein [Spirochaetia bacterium]